MSENKLSWSIGPVAISGRLALAPMAGVTDLAFRTICAGQGAAYTVSEMVSAKALLYKDKKTPKLLAPTPGNAPFSVQLFGSEPESVAKAAQIVHDLSGCTMIDLNMGCPAPKIVNNGDGCALMRRPVWAGKIIAETVKRSPVPVTVKFRKGWDGESENYLEFAKIAQESGAAALCIHGRTRAQMYAGKADWDAIAETVQAVKIPVIANGDVFTPEDLPRILSYTGAAAALAGRGALGNPWLFSRANALLLSGDMPPEPPLEEKLRVLVQQIELAAKDKGEHIAMLEARKHFAWYLKGIPGMKEAKARACLLTKLEDLYALTAALADFYEGRAPWKNSY